MGKKARMKTIRKIAATLPPMQNQATAKSIVTGAELLEQGTRTIPGEGAVRMDKKYVQSTSVAVEVNHSRRLRKVHTQLGLAGVKAYVANINEIAKAQLEASNADNKELAK
jgi:hypothetical protein